MRMKFMVNSCSSSVVTERFMSLLSTQLSCLHPWYTSRSGNILWKSMNSLKTVNTEVGMKEVWPCLKSCIEVTLGILLLGSGNSVHITLNNVLFANVFLNILFLNTIFFRRRMCSKFYTVLVICIKYHQYSLITIFNITVPFKLYKWHSPLRAIFSVIGNSGMKHSSGILDPADKISESIYSGSMWIWERMYSSESTPSQLLLSLWECFLLQMLLV